MSVQAMSWVLDHSTAEGLHRLVMLSIANHAGKFGDDAWPAHETIAEEARTSVSTVQRAVKQAEEAGELLVYPRAGRSQGRHKPNRYEMPCVPGWSPPPLSPRCDPHDLTTGHDDLCTTSDDRSNGNDDRSNEVDDRSQLRPKTRPLNRPSEPAAVSTGKPDWADKINAASSKRAEEEHARQRAELADWVPSENMAAAIKRNQLGR